MIFCDGIRNATYMTPMPANAVKQWQQLNPKDKTAKMLRGSHGNQPKPKTCRRMQSLQTRPAGQCHVGLPVLKGVCKGLRLSIKI